MSGQASAPLSEPLLAGGAASSASGVVGRGGRRGSWRGEFRGDGSESLSMVSGGASERDEEVSRAASVVLRFRELGGVLFGSSGSMSASEEEE